MILFLKRLWIFLLIIIKNISIATIVPCILGLVISKLSGFSIGNRFIDYMTVGYAIGYIVFFILLVLYLIIYILWVGIFEEIWNIAKDKVK